MPNPIPQQVIDAWAQAAAAPVETFETFGNLMDGIPGQAPQMMPKGKRKALEDDGTIMDITKTKISKLYKYSEIPAVGVTATQALSLYQERLEGYRIVLASKAVFPQVRNFEPLSTNPDALVGIEIEIEGWDYSPFHKAMAPMAVYEPFARVFWDVWNETKDDSLRDSGRELVTVVGLTAKEAPAALALLRLHIDTFYTATRLNYRCGTHVHVNVRDFTVEQLINMTMLYILHEDLFYRISGKRYKNGFCVPIRASSAEVEKLFSLVHTVKPTYKEFRDVFQYFKKYMAYNLLPVGYQPPNGPSPLGTVEFRHHRGESHPAILTRWLKYILKIHQYAQKLSFEELKDKVFDLNSVSNYIEFAQEVFGDLPAEMTREEIARDMYEGSGHIKELYLQAKGM